MGCAANRWLGLGVLFCGLLSACAVSELPPRPPVDTDTGPQGGDAGVDAGIGPGPGDALPTLRITAPSDGERVGPGKLRIEGEASDDRGLASVQVQVGPNVALRAETDDNFRHFWLESPVPPGSFQVVATAIDTGEQRSASAVVQLEGPLPGSDDGAPTITITAPEDGSEPAQTLVLITGTTDDDGGVVAIAVERNGELLTERPVETGDFFATWARLLPLLPGEDNALTFTATDAAGHTGSATVTLHGPVETDRDPPVLTVEVPAQGDTVSAASLKVAGTATDNVGIREVKVRVATAPNANGEPDWGQYTFCETMDGYETWSCPAVPLSTGLLLLQVKAVDLNGLVTTQEIGLQNLFVPEWSDEVGLPLRIREPIEKPVLTLRLDRAGVDQVLSEQIQRDTRILELETTTLLTSALDQIKNSCGTAWQNDNENPNHDCAAAFGPNWQSSPEYSVVRILTMTPANVVVNGTSIEGLQGIADQMGVGGGFRQILADALGIPRTQEIVGTAPLVRSLQDFFMADHPATLPGAKLPVTLYDAMHDLNPLATTLGPQGAHPGIVDPSYPVQSEVFTQDFEMLLEAESNLVWKEGIAVSGAVPDKDYIAVVFDDVGPSFDDVLEFDFQDPAKFDIQGLAASPTIDLRFALQEAPLFIDACTAGANPCQGNLPATPLDGYIWSRPRWEAETVVTGGAYYQYQDRVDYHRVYSWLFFSNAATVSVGYSGAPGGWAGFTTIANLGSPPPPQYLWELIDEVAQVALHHFGNTTLAEGEGNAAFTLSDIDVGLTADEIRTAVRPQLQGQRQKLSEQLLGDYAENNGPVDFYYDLGADGAPYAFFVADSDPLPDASYDYSKPGFFADPGLMTKLSTTDAGTSGDAIHEKLALAAGETTVYIAAEDGTVYRLRFAVTDDPSEIQVFVARRAD